MTIAVACECGKSLRLKDDLAGKKVRCPGCKTVLMVPTAEGDAPALQETGPAEPSSRLEEVRAQWRKKQPTYERDPDERYDVEGGDPEPERPRSRHAQRDEDDNYTLEEDDRRPEPPRKRRRKRASSSTPIHLPWNLIFGVGVVIAGFVVLALILTSVQADRSLSPRGVAGLIGLFVTGAGALFAYMNGEDE